MVSDFRAGNKNRSTGIEIGRDAGPLRTVEAFIGDSVLTGGPDHDVVILKGNLAVADCLFARGIKNPTGAIDRPSVLHHVIKRIDRARNDAVDDAAVSIMSRRKVLAVVRSSEGTR